jgi:hypothetical protein
MSTATKPSVLFVYHTYTQQTLKVVKAMAAGVPRSRFRDISGRDRIHRCALRGSVQGVSDAASVPRARRDDPGGALAGPGDRADPHPRGCDRAGVRPRVHRLSHVVALHERADPLVHGLGDGILKGKRFAVAVVCRRWRHNLKTVRRLGTERGGVFVDTTHFRYEGGQVRSLLSLCSYLGSGEYRQRYLGIKIPPTNIQEYHLAEAALFWEPSSLALLDRRSERLQSVGAA